ncbi:MAG: ABC transporter permease [Muribaculum sp.]|nr:ABC transporter permease [Muribaculum sp.]
MKNPVFDIDNWKEITATLARNKTRTFLTAFGIFWGTAMLALLWGGSQGMQRMLMMNFDGFSTNSCAVFPERTTIPYNGFKKGMRWSLTQTDIDNVRRNCPEIDSSTGMLNYGATIYYNDKNYSGSLQGVEPGYADINAPIMNAGRFINDVDERGVKKVCVVGSRIAGELFGSAEEALGKFVLIDNIYYKVIGVASQKAMASIGGRLDESVLIPLSTVRRTYNSGVRIDYFVYTTYPGIKPSSIKDRFFRTVRATHPIHPDDTAALEMWDVSEEFEQVESVFSGINILVLFVGLGSLLAGIIGVGNIMWIIVKERTQEIGIRRAIGAKPRDIIMQVLLESVVLTIVAGTAGICFAVLVLTVVSMATEEQSFQLMFNHAVTILLLFLVLGTVAGIIPAFKAMNIKPIEALNDK